MELGTPMFIKPVMREMMCIKASGGANHRSAWQLVNAL
jgi:hypothetical protein